MTSKRFLTLLFESVTRDRVQWFVRQGVRGPAEAGGHWASGGRIDDPWAGQGFLIEANDRVAARQ